MIAGGCPVEPVPATDGSTTASSDASSTTSGPGSSSVGGSFSGGLDTTTTLGTTATDDATDDTTTGEPSRGHARLVVGKVLAHLDDIDLVLLEYAEGVLSPPLSFTEDLPPGPVGATFADSGRVLAYCKFDPAAMEHPCFAVDLTTHPPGPAQPFFTEPIPANTLPSVSSWVEATQSFIVRLDSGGSPDVLFSAAFPGGVLQEPELIAQGGPGQDIGQDIGVRSDGAWVSYVLGPIMGPDNAFVAPLEPPDPSAAVMVSDIVDPELRASTPTFVTGQEAVLYTVGDGSYGSNEDSLWFVDISGPAPTAPLRVDDPLPDTFGLRGPRIAPDGHALLYWVGEAFEGDLMLVELAPGGPQPPVLVGTLVVEPTSIVEFRWSPDSRFITYLATSEQPDTPDLHLVEAPGDAPGEPVLVTGGLAPGGSVFGYAFDASSSWLYYVAEVDGPMAQLYRVDVSGAEPGAPQQVSGSDGSVHGNIIGSSDWSSVLYFVDPTVPSGRSLYFVDVSGAVPGEAVRVNGPLAEDIEVANNAEFSSDGSVVLYQELGPTGKDGDSQPVKLADLTSGEVHLASANAVYMKAVVD